MKISKARIQQIIKEELFYREFYHDGQQLAEDKVGNKISKLKDEGKPHKQAVAIALDMERRDELEESEEAYRALDAEKERKWRERWIKSIPPEERKVAGVEYPEDDPTLRTIRPGEPASFKPARKHKK